MDDLRIYWSLCPAGAAAAFVLAGERVVGAGVGAIAAADADCAAAGVVDVVTGASPGVVTGTGTGADDEVGGTADGGVVVNTVTVLPLAMLMLTPVPPLACVHVATCAFGP